MIEIALRRLFRVVNGGTPTSDEANWNGEVLWATPVDLSEVDGRSIISTNRMLTREGLESGSAAVPEGALVLSTRAPIGYVASTTTATAFNQGCRGLVPRVELDLRFFRYQLLARRHELTSRGQGSTFTELSSDALASFKVNCPDATVQRHIADLLDAETRRIDALVEKKRHLIDLLAESFRSRLIHATLAGPRRIRLRRLFEKPVSGTWGADPGEADIDALCVRGTDFDTETMRVKADGPPMRSVPADEFALRALKKGDIVIEKSGGGEHQPVGRVVIFDLDSPAFPTNFAARLIPARGEITEFLVFLLAACYATGATRSAIKQTTGIQNLDMDAFLSTEVSTSDVFEQPAVSAALSSEQARVLSLRRQIEKQIDLMREHRQALITAAVTGQLDISKAPA